MSILIPKNNNEGSIGTSSKKWKEVFALTSSIGTSFFQENNTNLELSGSALSVLSGISGSLTQLSNGSSYIVEGNKILITSSSNGPINISTYDKIFSSKSSGFTGSINYHYSVDTTSAEVNAELPLIVADFSGKEIRFKRKTGNNLVLNIPDGSSNTIDGSSSYTLSTNYQSVLLVCDGSSNWEVV